MSCAPTLNYRYINSPNIKETNSKVIPIWIDTRFSKEDGKNIKEGLSQWELALNGYIKFNIVSTKFNMEDAPLKLANNGKAWIFIKIDSSNPILKTSKVFTNLTLSFTDDLGGHYVYMIRDRFDDNWTKGLVMHEVGHLLGAADDHGNDLMNATYHLEDTECIDKTTLTQVANYQHLPIQNLNYCIYN
jgi:hypothetical protein